MVYVLNKYGKPLMPTTRYGRARRLLRKGLAVVVDYRPFTIQLTYVTPNGVQEVRLWVDAGTKHVGFSATTKKKVLFEAELLLRSDIVEKISTRREFRRARRNRKTRYRKSRFLNRTCSKKPGWIAPSVRQKVDCHIHWISKICKLLPISKITVVDLLSKLNFTFDDVRNGKVPPNHRIVHIEEIPGDDVYCLTNFEYGNFALSAGVFVHNCGMLVCKISPEYQFNYERLDKLIRLNIPSGMNHRKTLHTFAKNVDLSGLVADTDRNKLLYSVGSLGGGNHFIEVDVDEAGDHYIVIHSGSRYLGQVVCKFHQQRAIDRYLRNRKATGDETQYPSNLAWLEGTDVDDYLNDMKICSEFSYWSRKTMLQEILDGMDIKRRYIMEEFTTLHNYVDVDNKIIRKGSISLQDGERAIIPMNMRDGSLIVTGKGNAAANFSGPHGAGRVLSRGDAKAKLSMEDFKAAMEGIYSTSVRTSTIDESPMAYKPVQAILDNIGDLCTVDTVIKPEYNFKAS